MPMDDLSLLRAYADDRSEEAFRELVRRHAALVHAVARRQPGVDVHLADDITQRVFIALTRKAGSLHQSVTLLGWLYVAARREAAHVVRTETRRRQREERTELMETLHPSPAEIEISWGILSPVLDAAMADLGEAERDAILLRFFAGRSLPMWAAHFRSRRKPRANAWSGPSINCVRSSVAAESFQLRPRSVPHSEFTLRPRYPRPR